MMREAWLSRHPYLQSVADFQLQIETAAAGLPVPPSPLPSWDEYRSDFLSGIPLLHSSGAAIDLGPAEDLIIRLIVELASRTPRGEPGREIPALAAQLRSEPDAPRRTLNWLIRENEFTPEHPGLLRYLGWTFLRRFLRPIVEAFASWRDEERWLRRYCPACGSLPAMAELVGFDSGRVRLLSCGCCGTRWRYLRTGCPFCENGDDHRLPVLTIEGENGLRIDCCELCGGYLKTYAGRGNESFLLEDWTTLHLDIIARDRGLNRLASSLFEL
jgi:FdhE protein